MKGVKLCVAVVISNLASVIVTTVAVLYVFNSTTTTNTSMQNGLTQGHRKEQACDCECEGSPMIPLTATSYACPAVDGASIDFVVAEGGNLIEFDLSTGDRLCTLVQVAPDRASFKPIGRSYNGHNWETSAGQFSSSVSFACNGAMCTANLASLANTGGAVYQLTSFDVPESYNGQRDEIARFLEQTTFGPTKEDLNAFGTPSNLQSAFANWIKTQQTTVPITSHRALFRRHTNARMEHASGFGAVTHPCQAGTRYRRYTFSIKDRREFVEIRTVGNKKVISIHGFVRTVIEGPVAWYLDDTITFDDGSFLIPWSFDLNYIGGNIFLTHPDRGVTEVSFNGVYGNPPINFDPSIGASPNVLITSLSTSNAQPIDSQYFQDSANFPVQELILTQDLSDAVCSSLREPGNPINPVFATFEGQYWMHDPRFETINNTVESPAKDGGGGVKRETTNVIQPDLAAKCANAPRTFLNEDNCQLSFDPLACNSKDTQDQVRPEFYVTLDHPTIRTIYEQTGRYLYVIDGLRYADDLDISPPCQRGTRSRWKSVTCTGAATNTALNRIFGAKISDTKRFDENPILRNFYYRMEEDCPIEVFQDSEFEVQDLEGECWLNIHPDNLSVFDFTVWTNLHPGNSATRNPIKEFAAAGQTTLNFPWWHEMSRWTSDRYRFGYAGTLGDVRHYYDLPLDLRTYDLSVALGFTADALPFTPSDGIIVCGSPYEIANDLSLGGSQGRGAFDSLDWDFYTTDRDDFSRQKRVIWTQAALTSTDQLRQRVAWALAQILVVSPDSITNGVFITEAMTTYYDIFVRHAFGNYRNILKEVSYSPLMAEMLTYYGSRSTAYTWRIFENLEYADENFAREIMQLFTMGLYRLNQDGSQIIGENGNPERAYTNDDIVEYARAWTGFVAQDDRGNVEQGAPSNQVDPMIINMEHRDVFPKMGLDRQYIGDGYPLCADLPERHFLKKGAKYRLLGKNSSPDLLEDPVEWEEASTAQRFILQPNGGTSLYAKLCKSEVAANCQYDAVVLLDETIMCSGAECTVDTLRVVEVGGVYYEYIRPPCVYQAFFRDARMVVKRFNQYDLKCADPRTQVASATCCTTNTGEFMDEYWGERTTFATAQQRCSNEQELCSNSYPRPNCYANPEIRTYCESDEDFWTNIPCTLRAKIDSDGNVAIIHEPLGIDPSSLSPLIHEADAKTFFRVDWTGADKVENIIENCNSFDTCTKTSDGMCMCDVTVTEEQVFVDGDSPSADDMLTALRIGAFDPSVSATDLNIVEMDSVTAYTVGGSLTAESVFSVTNDRGTHFRKNQRSSVSVVGTSLGFRNPPHFVSLSDPELRDGQDETDAALNHYFFHSNTAPFLAIRFAQRFGISNPSPRYIGNIATAFRTGSYFFNDGGSTMVFGSGDYGDLGATIACVLLDRDARSPVLDADPSHGSLKEPLMKMIGLLRSMEFSLFDDIDFVDFDIDLGIKLGQMAHDLPNVFSFFLPEYEPPGPVAQASLVAPEAQVITGPRVIDTLNGMLSLIKYGHSTCYGGLAPRIRNFNCGSYVAGASNEESLGRVAFVPTNDNSGETIVDELSTLLTSGRLSQSSRRVISQVVDEEPNAALALIKAQQLMLFSPEFHSTGVTRRTGKIRPELQVPPPSSRPYKAVVYVLLDGGMDSFNMLAPHSCRPTNSQGSTLLQQYNAERTSLAFTEAERIRIIDAANQPCDQFVIHQNLEIVERLYNEGDLAFFANAGVLNKPVTKKNYGAQTTTQLFSHSDMQQEVQKMDPFDGAPGTGILGRMCDILNTKGFNAQPITVEDATIATVGVPGTGVAPLFVSSYGASEFNPKPESETFDPKPSLKQLNDDVDLQSNIFGETWSQRFQKALHDNESLLEALENTELTQQFEDNQYARKLKAVSTLIVSHGLRGTDRDVFYVSLSGWDNHSILKDELEEKFGDLNSALTSFYNEMLTQNYWNDVSLVITSDFGRTLTANSGDGSDHAWGGNYFVMGGAVAGGKIHGEYPPDITADGPLNVGRGRLIPTMSWESILNPLAEWMGVDTDAELNQCMPNRVPTGTKMFTRGEVFE